MKKMIGQIVTLRAALWVNSFLYYFQRLWLVGKLAPNSVYTSYGLKKVLSYVALALRQIVDFCCKPLYLLAFLGAPALMLAGMYPQFKGQLFALMVYMLFFLNFILGSFGDSRVFTVTRDKVTLIKYMHVNARTYIQASLAIHYVPFFLYYLVCLVAAALLCGAPAWQGVLVWGLFVSFRMMGEAFHLFVFDRTGKVLIRNMGYEWLCIVLGLAGAYVPPFLGLSWHTALTAFLLHPLPAAALLAAGGACLYYLVLGYQGYERKLPRSLDLNFLLSSMLNISAAASFKEVEVREADVSLSETEQEKFRHLKGYDYLNALFFARHRRQLLKPVWFRLALVALGFAGTVAVRVFSPETALSLSRNLTLLLPSFIFIMYSITVADKSCRAMFYNCDKDLLRYAWYRQPKVILRNFEIRLRRVGLYNGAVAAAVCLAAAGFCLVCGTSVFTADFGLFCAVILLLSLLFTAHHLCLYYIFQPYSESLQTKNPFFSLINAAMYMLCFLCLQIKVQPGGRGFTLAVLAFTILYITGALLLVYRRAPKSFRVK